MQGGFEDLHQNREGRDSERERDTQRECGERECGEREREGERDGEGVRERERERRTCCTS